MGAGKPGGTILKAQPKKKKAKKLTVTKVQDAVNYAIRMRDGVCINHDGTCNGRLEASHFFGKGGNGGLRFYPPNIHGQCSKHHFDPPPTESALLRQMDARKLSWRSWRGWSARGKVVKYSQPVLEDIMGMARLGQLDELTAYIEALICS